AQRLDPADARQVRPLVERLNAREIAAASARRTPPGTVTLDEAADQLFPAIFPGWLRRLLGKSPLLLVAVIVVLLLILGVVLFVAGVPLTSVFAVCSAAFAALVAWGRAPLPRWRPAAQAGSA